jgi:hypothetical protein
MLKLEKNRATLEELSKHDWINEDMLNLSEEM